MTAKFGRALALLACVVFAVVALAGCGATDPEQALEDTVTADMAQVMSDMEADDAALLIGQLDTDTLESVGVDPVAFAQALLDKTSLEVKSVTVDGDTGQAVVRFTSVNQSTQLKTWIDEMTEWSQSDAAHELYEQEGDEAVDNYIADAFLSVYTDDDAVMKTVEKKLSYTLEDGVWTLDGGLDAFEEEIMGDLDFTSVL